MSKQYSAAMIVIGNEILSGRTQDLNVNYVANKLVECGVVLSEVRVIPDIEDVIVSTIREFNDKVDYIFTSGGIGPTHDDITAASVAKAYGVALEEHAEAKSLLQAHYGAGDLNAVRLRMARIPVGAALIPNPVSIAPGFVIENTYVMAGVPRIMQAMMDHVASTLKGGAVIQSRTVSCALTESIIAKPLGAIQGKWGSIDIGSYPYFKDGVLGVNIVLRSSVENDLEQAINDVSDMVDGLIGT
ncbi:MAG: competence/damage-inducible protein A [Alphaproteobacteria bacterium]|nr:MAG: competence/damage-inducible protein A [Alphaproteobacteria bacterium]